MNFTLITETCDTRGCALPRAAGSKKCPPHHQPAKRDADGLNPAVGADVWVVTIMDASGIVRMETIAACPQYTTEHLSELEADGRRVEVRYTRTNWGYSHVVPRERWEWRGVARA